MSKSSAAAFQYTFPNGQTAHVLDVPNNYSYEQSLKALGLDKPLPSLVIIGGASQMSDESRAKVSKLFTKILAPLAEAYGITVFDGGTEAGVIQMMGQARSKIRGTFNLVGVAPKSKINLPGYSFHSSNEISKK